MPEAVTLFSPNQFVLAACPLQSTMKTLLELMLAGSIKTLRIPERGAIRVKNLNPGVYTVRWWATAVTTTLRGVLASPSRHSFAA